MEELRPFGIRGLLLFAVVIAAVNFDSQLFFGTIEIQNNTLFNRMLASKFCIRQLTIAQELPKQLFGIGLVLTKVPGIFDERFGEFPVSPVWSTLILPSRHPSPSEGEGTRLRVSIRRGEGALRKHLLKFLQHRPPNGLPAHILGDVTGRKKGAILIAVYLLENASQHRSINKRLGLFLHLGRALGIKVIGIQKAQQVFEGRKGFALQPLTILVTNFALAVNGHLQVILQCRDGNGIGLDLRHVKQGAVQIGNMPEMGVDALRALPIFAGQNLKEQLVQLIVLLNFFMTQKTEPLIFAMVFVELCLQQLQKQDAVDPGNQ